MPKRHTLLDMGGSGHGFTIFQIYRETSARVAYYEGLVAEGQCVDEASNFARWLRFSGVLKLIADNPQTEPLPTDGAGLAIRVANLVSACGEVYRKSGKGVEPQYKKSDIEMIRDTLAKIQEQLATPSLLRVA